MGLFAELHAAGMTIVIVTHDPAIAAWAPRVVTFRDGAIVSDVTTAAAASAATADANAGAGAAAAAQEVAA